MQLPDKPSYLETDSQKFQPPVPEQSLLQHSEKLVASTRMFPEWLAAAYGILRQKYPTENISTLSQLLQLITQDYIKQNYGMIDNSLPPTEHSVDFLIRNGFINPDSRTQFKRISRASDKSVKYEEQMMSSTEPRDQYLYWKDRDPEKAEAILEQMTADAVDYLFREDTDSEPEQPDSKNQPEDNSPVIEPKGFDSMLEQATKKQQDGIAGLDNMPTETVNEDSDAS